MTRISDNTAVSDRGLRKAIMSLAIIISFSYIVYRAVYTVSDEHLWFWIMLFAAELHGAMSFALFCFDIWDPQYPEYIEPEEDLSVDVFICTYNEDEELLRKTIIGAESMIYPHQTYLLDDGKRENIKQLAESFGIKYISRSDNKYAKAGNVNNALKQTDGEFVAILDADHVPLPDFLSRLLGQFKDPEVGIVQTPQTFYNFDAVEKDFSSEHGKQSEQSEIFFHLIMPGKNRWNSAYFCGTGGIFRRAALEQVGGFLTETITEDIETAIKLQALGWKSIYISEHLVSGLAPSDMGAYQTQRSRWAVGNLSVMFHQNPLFLPGLTIPQRLSYLSSMLYWTNGLRKTIFYLVPLLILIFGVFPAKNFTLGLILFFSVNVISQMLTFKLATYGRGQIADDEFYDMISFWVYTTAFFRACFNKKSQKFIITDKSGKSSFSIKWIVPQVILTVLCVISIVSGMIRMKYHVGGSVAGMSIAIFWCLWNMYFALMTIELALDQTASAEYIKFFDYIPLLYQLTSGNKDRVALVREYDSKSIEVYLDDEVEIGDQWDVTLILKSFRLPVKIEFVEKITVSNPKAMKCFRAEFLEVDRNYNDMLHAHTMLYTVPRYLDYLSKSGQSLTRAGIFESLRKSASFTPRMDFPVNLNPKHNSWEHCRTKNISSKSLTVVSDHPLELQSDVDFVISLPSGLLEGNGKITECNKVDSHGIDSWQCNLELNQIPSETGKMIKELNYA